MSANTPVTTQPTQAAKMKMSLHARDLLKEHAAHFAQMAEKVMALSDDDLLRLGLACKEASYSNCSWDVFRAARYIEDEVSAEQNRRLRLKRNAANG